MITNKYELNFLEEPLLEFAFRQKNNFSKDGLYLYGPLSNKKEIRYGVIGTKNGLNRLKNWIKQIQSYIPLEDSTKLHFSSFPGFQAVFKSELPLEPISLIEVPENEIYEKIRIENIQEAVYKTVSIYYDRLVKHQLEEDEQPDFWFIVIPEDIFKYGRPMSKVPKEERQKSGLILTKKMMKTRSPGQMNLLKQMDEEEQIYKYQENFRRQLKARLLKKKIPIQILRETTIAPYDFTDKLGVPLRQIQDPASIAWNLTSTMLYKTGHKPYKLADIRDGVCYIGLVFKKLDNTISEGNACCGAQMFLDSGDGLVFKGAVGHWYDNKTKQFHLSKEKAKELMKNILNSYIDKQNIPPTELFIHGRTFFDDEEWAGFNEAVAEYSIKLTGIRIYESKNELKLFRASGKRPIARGTVFKMNNKKAYLWTTGHITRFNTYPGFSVPNPISVEVCQGEADIDQVLKDVFALTKVNFNNCWYGDNVPVTLKFADAVGEILTASPLEEIPPLPFRYYI